jgi:L-fucose mutarotase/ribose pyranase (RbsD/FucU family)
MLIGIDPRVTPELLSTLARMGHGDEIVIVDLITTLMPLDSCRVAL